MQTSVAYLRGRADETDRTVLAALAADVADLAAPEALAARTAAIQLAVGNGWQFNARFIAAPFRKALADLALRLGRADGRFASLADLILGDWRFQQTEDARVVRAALLSDVTTKGAVTAMPLLRLALYLNRVAWNSPEATEALWRSVVDALLARWRATAEPADAEILAGLARRVIDGRGALAERLAFLRERLAKAGDRDARAIAQDLFDSIVGGPHAPVLEDEAFALLPRLLDARDDDATSRARAAAASRRLSAWVYEARLAAASGTPEARAKWTRAEATQHAADARKQARLETAARLATAVAAAGVTFRPWLEAERLGYAAESLADLAKTEGDARELLDAVPTSSDAEIDALLAERAALVLAYAATRRTTPDGLADRVLALLRARLEAKDKTLDDRYELFRLLVALDRVEELEKALLSWIRPDDVDVTWRVALAYVQAETGRLREAATTLETAATLAELGADEWERLATWYLVLKEDARREHALDRRDAALSEGELSNRLWQEANRVQRRGDGVPPELDPEALRYARALLFRAESPQMQVQPVLRLYGATKDFRLLESLADGLAGHSPEAQYAALEQVTQAISDVFEEATCDAVTARAGIALARAKTDTDRRALHLLVAAVESRAGAVPHPDPRHGPRAIEALRQAAAGAYVPGERALLAAHLASMGAPADGAFAAEQLRQLEALLAGATEGAWEAFSIGQHLAAVLWARGRQQDAADRLASLLDAVRADSGGTLPQGAQPTYEHAHRLVDRARALPPGRGPAAGRPRDRAALGSQGTPPDARFPALRRRDGAPGDPEPRLGGTPVPGGRRRDGALPGGGPGLPARRDRRASTGPCTSRPRRPPGCGTRARTTRSTSGSGSRASTSASPSSASTCSPPPCRRSTCSRARARRWAPRSRRSRANPPGTDGSPRTSGAASPTRWPSGGRRASRSETSSRGCCRSSCATSKRRCPRAPTRMRASGGATRASSGRPIERTSPASPRASRRSTPRKRRSSSRSRDTSATASTCTRRPSPRSRWRWPTRRTSRSCGRRWRSGSTRTTAAARRGPSSRR